MIFKPPPQRPAQSTPIEPGGVAGDAFGRLRVSNPTTLFDCKQIHDNTPLFFDDAETSGGSTTSTHSTARASTILGVAATTAGTRVRQTFQRFNYQPGKSLFIMLTGILIASGGGTGITSKIGYFDSGDGLFFGYDAGTVKVGVRSSVSGSPVDTEVSQSSWNEDKLDGTGPSGVTADWTKVQIFWFDMEWLGVGRARFGIISPDGEIIVCHAAKHANTGTSVYMSTPNLPVRYEISNSGTGAASTLEQICSTVITEGGFEKTGQSRFKSTAGTHVDANADGTLYAVVGLRLKSTHLDATILIESVSLMAETGNDFEWVLLFNPTVAGTFTYADETSSAVQSATGATANTVTGGSRMAGGFVKSSNSTGAVASSVSNALRLGAKIDGTRDTIVLAARPNGTNADIQGAIQWREIS